MTDAPKPQPFRQSRIFLLLLTLAAAFAFQGTRGLYESTEGRYAESAREMIETGQWLIPQLDYRPHWTKPPLTYWAIALGMKVFGQNERGVRFYSGVAFALSVWAILVLGGWMWDKPTGFFAALIYATSPLTLIAAHTVNTDTLLTLWEILVALGYWGALRRAGERAEGGALRRAGERAEGGALRRAGERAEGGKRGESGWIGVMWFSAGMAFFTKGPPGLLVLGAMVVFHIIRRRRGQITPRMFQPASIVLFLVVALWWYLWADSRTKGLASYFLKDEVVGRVLSGMHHRHSEWYQPFVIYVPVLLFGAGVAMIAWAALIHQQTSLFRWNNLCRAIWKNDRLLFLSLWVFIPLSIFFMVHSRLHLYVLPLFPAVALATARLLALFAGRRVFMRTVVGAMVLFALVLVAGRGVFAVRESERNMGQLYKAIQASSAAPTRVFAYRSSYSSKGSTPLEMEARMFGLQFYLNGKLTRVEETGPLPDWARGLDGVIKDLRAHPEQGPSIFVTGRRDQMPELAAAFEAAGISWNRVNVKSPYKILITGAAPD